MWEVKYNIEESILIDTDIKTVWHNIFSFEASQKWSPWVILDNTCKIRIEGKDCELGSIYFWDGEIIGSGEMKHTQMTEEKSLDSTVTFMKPFKTVSHSYFRLSEEGGKVRVVWGINSSLPFFMFFMKNMIKSFIAKDYQRGLNMLKIFCETGEVPTKTIVEKNVYKDGFYYIGIKNSSHLDKIGSVISNDIGILMKSVSDKNIEIKNNIVLYSDVNHKNDIYNFITSIIISKEDYEKFSDDNTILRGYYPSTNTLKVAHKGSYDFISNSWTAATSALFSLKLKKNNSLYPFELYINSPMEVEAKDLITEIYMPLK